jgi:hypothetical protein
MMRITNAAHVLLRILCAVAALAVPFLCAAVYRAWVAKELLGFALFLLPLVAVFAASFLRYIRTKA